MPLKPAACKPRQVREHRRIVDVDLAVRDHHVRMLRRRLFYDFEPLQRREHASHRVARPVRAHQRVDVARRRTPVLVRVDDEAPGRRLLRRGLGAPARTDGDEGHQADQADTA